MRKAGYHDVEAFSKMPDSKVEETIKNFCEHAFDVPKNEEAVESVLRAYSCMISGGEDMGASLARAANNGNAQAKKLLNKIGISTDQPVNGEKAELAMYRALNPKVAPALRRQTLSEFSDFIGLGKLVEKR